MMSDTEQQLKRIDTLRRIRLQREHRLQRALAEARQKACEAEREVRQHDYTLQALDAAITDEARFRDSRTIADDTQRYQRSLQRRYWLDYDREKTAFFRYQAESDRQARQAIADKQRDVLQRHRLRLQVLDTMQRSLQRRRQKRQASRLESEIQDRNRNGGSQR